MATTAETLPSVYAIRLGQRLRDARIERGLSLRAVEETSGRRWKSVVIGSYERGSRAITVDRLRDYAEFLGVPTADLIPNINPWHDAIQAGA